MANTRSRLTARPRRIPRAKPWLLAAAVELAADFGAAGYELPRMRFAIAFPSQRAGSANASANAGRTATAAIRRTRFIRADQQDLVEVLAILVHEIVHAVVGF
jgi:hypothetical protein